MKKDNSKVNFLGMPLYKLADDEKYMSEGMRNHFLNVLNFWKMSLMKDVDLTVKNLQETSNFADPVDRASDEEERSLELRTRDRERKLLCKIESTINKILANKYGYCDICGNDITLARLEARPTASECIDCKSFAEQREKVDGC